MVDKLKRIFNITLPTGVLAYGLIAGNEFVLRLCFFIYPLTILFYALACFAYYALPEILEGAARDNFRKETIGFAAKTAKRKGDTISKFSGFLDVLTIAFLVGYGHWLVAIVYIILFAVSLFLEATIKSASDKFIKELEKETDFSDKDPWAA